MIYIRKNIDMDGYTDTLSKITSRNNLPQKLNYESVRDLISERGVT